MARLPSSEREGLALLESGGEAGWEGPGLEGEETHWLTQRGYLRAVLKRLLLSF